MANCLVTGGCGFIGRHLVAELVRQGHRPFVVDTDKKGYERNPHVSPFDYRSLDVAELPRLHLVAGWMKVRFDVVFHLAAVSRTVPAMEDPLTCCRTNVLGTAVVLERSRQAGVPRVVVSSSNVVMAGATPYRDSKRAVEEMCGTYASLYGQPVVALRYSNVYGPGIPKGDPAVFAMLRDSFLDRGYAEVTGDGRQTRDFTHVSDIARGNLMAWKSPHRGVVDLCTGVQTSIADACAMLKIPVRHVGDRPGDIPCMRQDPRPAEQLLKWKAGVSIAEGIGDVWTT